MPAKALIQFYLFNSFKRIHLLFLDKKKSMITQRLRVFSALLGYLVVSGLEGSWCNQKVALNCFESAYEIRLYRIVQLFGCTK